MRWVEVKEDHTISWSIRPDKKSINFGIFKHPGSGGASTPKLPSSNDEPPPTPGLPSDVVPNDGESVRNASSTAAEKLKSIGLIPIQWHGSCESNRVSSGKYDVPQGDGGMYAMVFDNTFSKQQSKKATFVLLTYPTKSPPQSNHHMHHFQNSGAASSTSLKETLGNKKKLTQQPSSESVPQSNCLGAVTSQGSDGSRTSNQNEKAPNLGSSLFTGVLQKRRRKKHQGWARRFFSLDYDTSTLSYYHDRNTLSLRGAIPLSLAAVGANGTTRQISIDSGAEVWHLKASSQKDFEAWKNALELAHAPPDPKLPVIATRRSSLARRTSEFRVSPEEEREWSRLEVLVARVRASRDSARDLAKDTDPKYLSSPGLKPSLDRLQSDPMSSTSSASESPSEQSFNSYFVDGANDRRSFWKRKPSSDRPMPGMFKRSVSATPSLSTPQRSNPPTPLGASFTGPETKALQSHPEEGIHDHCMSLLRDLDAIVADFDTLIFEGKQRREPVLHSSMSRHSVDSQDQEFFDAEGFDSSQLLDIYHETDEEASDRGSVGDVGSGSDSEADEPERIHKQTPGSDKANPAFPDRPDSLQPLPCVRVKRRVVVRSPTVNPPSLIGFLRKNVGKDLSTIAMPVSANEPISLLQRISELLGYTMLLDTACSTKSSPDRLIYVTAFAISQLSSTRVKERAIRKPFNPMLGETFELVREDRKFRFLAEKISHRPVRLACQAESDDWSLTHSPLPTQKFWGKSAELTTEGKIRIMLHGTGDRYSWTPATSFLRNIIAGEKYVEPVGTMTILNETTSEKAIATFKSGGMFSGRSEDVFVQTYDAHGVEMPLGLMGRWTASLAVTENKVVRSNGNPIWTVAELAPDAARRYGFTAFTSSLNEITDIEEGKLPPTDSRLRPDQRAVEDGDIDTAETAKAKLEEAQRQRRKVMEEQGVEWQPKWFERVEAGDGEEVWVQKRGSDGYWERRLRGDWEGVEKVFES